MNVIALTIFLGVLPALSFWALVVFDAYDQADHHAPPSSLNPAPK